MLLFVHDHKFRKVGNLLYSTGGLDDRVIQRYRALDDEVVIYARIIDEGAKQERWSQIGDDVKIQGNNSLVGTTLENEVFAADCVIIRLPSFLGYQACHYVRKYKKPYMIELVGCPWDSLNCLGIKGRSLAPFCYLLTRKYVKEAPFVLYVTSKFLQKRYPTQGRSLACSDVVIDSLTEITLNRRIERIHSSRPSRIIGTIGAIDVQYKGQQRVIEALALLQNCGNENFIYQLVGNGDTRYLSQIAKECGVLDRVQFIGGLPHEAINEWLDSIDIYIQPSMVEGLPRALIEAQSRALPCFGTSVGGIPELLNNNCLFKNKGSVDRMIASYLLNLTTETEDELARQNFYKSSKYQRELLEPMRESFYGEFKDWAIES